ncbi:MAG: rubrerythrin family protein [Candidatus Pacebacteria bacterium]|nr:rubrerythrin family protein [Candidatus Paceibacterota bacterium]
MQTLKNLSKAFIGESQARNRYDFYAKIAKKEGYEQIAEIFLITAENEKAHAKRLFEHIQKIKSDNQEILVDASVPNIYGNTIDNLQSAIEGENHEYTQMYPDFAKTAEQEGYEDVAIRLRSIAKAEEHHEQRFKKVLEQLKKESIFKKDQEIEWVCRECGYVHKGTEPPEKCPSCDHPRAFYQVKCEQY